MATGYNGTIDWTGLPEGMVVPPATCGYSGIVDWAGPSCGAVVSDAQRIWLYDERKKAKATYKKASNRSKDIVSLVAFLLGEDDL